MCAWAQRFRGCLKTLWVFNNFYVTTRGHYHTKAQTAVHERIL